MLVEIDELPIFEQFSSGALNAVAWIRQATTIYPVFSDICRGHWRQKVQTDNLKYLYEIFARN